MSDREARLPRWAQAELKRLREEVQGLRLGLSTARGLQPAGLNRIVAEVFTGGDFTQVGIPVKEISFRTGEVSFDREAPEIHVRSYNEGDGIEVRADRGPLKVTPVASNVIIIEQEG